ncbi:MAG: DUF3822 family protein [Flavobacteriaceae bacterium]
MSVQVALTGLSFLVSSQQREVLHFSEKTFDTLASPEDISLALSEELNSQLAYTENIQEVTLIHSSPYYTIVPKVLFVADKASEYLKFNTKILSNDFVAHDTLEGHAIEVVYLPFVNINNLLFDTFGSFSYYHASTLFLKYVLNNEKHAQEAKAYIRVSEDFFDMIVVKNGKLLLCNNYHYKSPEDFIYFTLFCLEQLQLNPNSIKTLLCGVIDENSTLYHMLYTYVRHVSFLEATLLSHMDKAPHEHFILKTVL